MELTMTIRSSLLSWLYANPHVAQQDIALTTVDQRSGRDPLHVVVRLWGSHSPPDLPDGVSRTLLQDIGLDRSRS
jgi:hypothetical protein